VILETTTAREELKRRLRARARDRTEASEADTDVLAYQERHAEPLDEQERKHCISVETDEQRDINGIVDRMRVL